MCKLVFVPFRHCMLTLSRSRIGSSPARELDLSQALIADVDTPSPFAELVFDAKYLTTATGRMTKIPHKRRFLPQACRRPRLTLPGFAGAPSRSTRTFDSSLDDSHISNHYSRLPTLACYLRMLPFLESPAPPSLRPPPSPPISSPPPLPTSRIRPPTESQSNKKTRHLIQRMLL